MAKAVRTPLGGRLLLRAGLLLGAAIPAHATLATDWQTVVNNAVVAPQAVPNGTTPYFFSYNQPAVNQAGKVAFRARAKPPGGQGGSDATTQGVYYRQLSLANSQVGIVADNTGVPVPAPNNTGATFIEFPSTARIDSTTGMITTRGQSQGVFTLPDGTREGTSGIYATPGDALTTAASQLGNIPDYNYFQVPDTAPGIRFDQFPGSPAPLRNRFIVFKGNYTETDIAMTGIFYRDMLASGGTAPVRRIARTGTPIPGGGGAIFGSTAPPSAATDPGNGRSKVVFAGFDNEDRPTAGGIYITYLDRPQSLRPIISLGDVVPGAPGFVFTGFGEAVSFDGRYVSFWGSWGKSKKIVHENCPTDGNKYLIAYCLEQYPNGADLTESVNQGVFRADTQNQTVRMVARTQKPTGFTDFLYWTYSGKPPGSPGGGDAEPPRWRSSAFTAVTSLALAFKGQKASIDGLYVYRRGSVQTVLDTTMDGQSVDPMAPLGSLVSAIGLERDGFRGSWLAISAGMTNTTTAETWAGLYAHDCGKVCSVW